MSSEELVKEISIESSKNFVGRIGGKVLDYVLVLLLARYLKPSGFGIYATGFMLASVMTIISRLGLNSGVTRFVSKSLAESREHDIVNIYLFTAITTVGISILIAGVAIVFSPWIADLLLDGKYVTVVIIFCLSVPFRVLLQVSLALFGGFNDMGVRAIIGLSRDTLEVFVAAVLILLGVSIQYLVFGIVSVLAFIAIVATGLAIKRLLNHTIAVKLKRMRSLSNSMIVYSAPLWLVTLSNLGIEWADILFLSYFTESAIVGIYRSASALSSGFAILLLTFSTPFFPMASRLYTASKLDQLEDLFQLLTRWINVIMLPAFVFAFVFAVPVMTIIFGEEYVQAAAILRVLLVGMFVSVAAGNNIVLLKSSDNTRIYFYLSVIAGLINIFLNTILIPLFGGVGAAIATSTSLGILNLSIIVLIYHMYGIWGYRPLKVYPIYVISAAVTLIPIILIAELIRVNILLFAPVYALLYFCLIAILNGFTTTDKAIFKSGFRYLKKHGTARLGLN